MHLILQRDLRTSRIHVTIHANDTSYRLGSWSALTSMTARSITDAAAIGYMYDPRIAIPSKQTLSVYWDEALRSTTPVRIDL